MKVTCYPAVIEHRHGVNFYTAFSAADLEAQIYDYVQEWWDEVSDANIKSFSKEYAIDLYFQKAEDESLIYGPVAEQDIPLPAGWRLVPKDPTAQMIKASNSAIRWYEADATSRACYSAMLAAAPSYSPIDKEIVP